MNDTSLAVYPPCNTIQYFVPLVSATFPGNVKRVQTAVVPISLAAIGYEVPFATGVPLGALLLSVSIVTFMVSVPARELELDDDDRHELEEQEELDELG